MIKNVSIESSSNTPTAGENLTLTCSVVSDAPTVLRWIGPNEEHIGVDSHNPNLSLRTTDGYSSVTSLPLHTSNAGIYTCIAHINGITSAQTVEEQHSFTVQSEL